MKIKDPKGVVTNERLDEAVDAILQGMDIMAKEKKKEMQKFYDELSKKIDENTARLEGKIDDQTLDTITRREFEALKSKVNKLSLQ